MLAHTLKMLTNKARARSSDPLVHAVCNALDMLALDIEAGRRKRACPHCRSQYRKERQWTKAWHNRTGYNQKRRKAKANSAP